MLITERKFGIYKIVNIFFIDEPMTVNIPDCDVVTYHTYKNWGEINGYERENFLTTIIDLRQDIDVIWNKMKRQHKRHIRRAEKNGTKVITSKNYEEFFQINKKFLTQKNFVHSFGLNIFSSKFMQKYGTLFIAENQGEIVAGNLYFNDEQNALLVNYASQNIEDTIDIKKQNTDAYCYLQWKAMQYFKNLGVINYDLGGDLSGHEIKINHQMDGGEYFKRSFGGDVISRYHYRKFNSRFSKLLFNSRNFLQIQK